MDARERAIEIARADSRCVRQEKDPNRPMCFLTGENQCQPCRRVVRIEAAIRTAEREAEARGWEGAAEVVAAHGRSEALLAYEIEMNHTITRQLHRRAAALREGKA